jgi:hypothetical protein
MMDDLFLFGLILVGLLIVAGGIVWGIHDAREWEKFAAEHHCRVVERTRGESYTGVGLSPNGGTTIVSGSTAPKTAYLCDDGVKYWR